MPPKTGENSAHEIGHHVARIADGPAHDVRADQFEQDGPDKKVKGDFTHGGELVVLAQLEPALEQEQGWQGAGDQQEVIEMVVKERAVDMGLEDPPVQRVKPATDQEKTVTQIAEGLQRRARMIIPKPIATASFKSKAVIII